jgi:cell division protein FtsW (lipid II flippase)
MQSASSTNWPMTENRSAIRDSGPISTFTSTIRIKLRAPARLRNLELALLILAFAIDFGAIVLVQFGALGAIDSSTLVLFGLLGILLLAMHVTMRVVAPDADPLILPIITVLNGLGIAMIYRLDIADDLTGWEGAGTRQIAWTALAVVIAIAVLVVIRNHRVLQRYRFVAMFTGILLLVLPMLPLIGTARNGARLWVEIGPFSFQPGELGKVALAIFFAGYLVTARDSLSMVGRKVLWMTFPRARDLGPLIVVFAASMLVLVVQRDLGTALLYFGLFLVMTYVATGRSSWIVLGLGLFLLGAFVASRVLSYVGGRVDAWLDAFNPEIYDATGGSYQLVQGMFGLADGGLIGTGWGQGSPEITPLAESDYIVSALGEELGLIGLFAILALYLLFVARGFRIGFAGQDDFGRLLGVGLAFVIALQVFVVIGGVTRVIPLTGLTTPFLAAGGSSLVANWIIAALLLRLSDTVRHQPLLVVDERSVDERGVEHNNDRLVIGQ